MTRDLIIVLIVALVTMLIRYLPFIIFSGNRKTPAFITYLGKVLPYSIMAMLLVYCLRNVSLINSPHGLPELIACAIIVVLHAWKRNTLLSIIAGTVSYMLLIQFVFI